MESRRAGWTWRGVEGSEPPEAERAMIVAVDTEGVWRERGGMEGSSTTGEARGERG